MEVKTRAIYKDDFTEYLLCLALDVGEGMLKNGGEVARVEDTIERICRAYGAEHVEVFTIVSMINAAVRMSDGSYSSQLRRVKQTGNNLGMLESLNALSREICSTTPSLDSFDEKLHELKKTPAYSTWMAMISSAVGAAAFCLFFGGKLLDSLVTFVIGIMIYGVNNYTSRRLNSMAKTVLSSFLASTVAAVASLFMPYLGVDYIIIGAIMLLVPGLIFGTALRDLFLGDLIAGTLKVLQALIQTLMIAFGYMLTYSIFSEALISASNSGSAERFGVQIITAVITSVAFAVVFKTNKRHLVASAVCGVFTFVSYYLIYSVTESLFWAAFVSSVVAAALCEVNARLRRAPAIVVLMPAVISIVPGGYLYRAAREFVEGRGANGFVELGSAAAIALGLAGGIVVTSIILLIVTDWIKKLKNNNNVNNNSQNSVNV